MLSLLISISAFLSLSKYVPPYNLVLARRHPPARRTSSTERPELIRSPPPLPSPSVACLATPAHLDAPSSAPDCYPSATDVSRGLTGLTSHARFGGSPSLPPLSLALGSDPVHQPCPCQPDSPPVAAFPLPSASTVVTSHRPTWMGTSRRSVSLSLLARRLTRAHQTRPPLPTCFALAPFARLSSPPTPVPRQRACEINIDATST